MAAGIWDFGGIAARLSLLVLVHAVSVDCFRGSTLHSLSLRAPSMVADRGSRDLYNAEPVEVHTCRSVFSRRASTRAFTVAAGAVLFPGACVPSGPPTDVTRPRVPRYIDVTIDLGLGEGRILNVRQPYGLPKESKKDGDEGGDRQGTYVWPASTDLAKFLVSEQGRKLVQTKNVVELGAGTAISGLAASIAGAAWVAFTDGSPEVLQVTRDTVQRNGLRLDGEAQQCVVERLRWGNQQDLTSLLAKSRGGARGYDVVLGAEITYLSSSIDPLFDSIFALLSTSANAQNPKGDDAPLALLTFTPELTCFDGGGVKELEEKAGTHGLRLKYLEPPPNNPDPDTLLLALTLRDT